MSFIGHWDNKSSSDFQPDQNFDKNNSTADLSAGGEGGLLPSGVFLPPLVLSLQLEGLLGLTLNQNMF